MNLEYTTELADEITGARSLTAASASAVLNDIANRCKNNIVVFDLDSTLLDNRGRNAKIMQEFGELHNEPILTTAKAEHWQDWNASKAMTAMGLPAPDVEKLIDAYTTFWEEKFFTSQYCQYDSEVQGAADYVKQLQHSGAIIRYLTGRHEEMRAGTLGSLSVLGFPVPGSESDDAVLIMKPEQSIPDDTYKKNVMNQLIKKFDVLAAFDNEPFHINTYREAYPKAVCVHLNTDHSGRSIRLLGNIVSIANFTR